MLITIPAALATPADLDRVVASMRRYGDGEFAVGVLTHGTCFFPTPGQSFVSELARLFGKMRDQSPDFEVREMDDHNYVVAFGEHVVAVVSRDEFQRNRAVILKEARYSESSERILDARDSPRDHLLIGLYARTRLFADMENPQIARIIQEDQN
jgi:hypothetical protein